MSIMYVHDMEDSVYIHIEYVNKTLDFNVFHTYMISKVKTILNFVLRDFARLARAFTKLLSRW